eukprot:TRINITY_DN13203_c0_g1_i5.p2 TRINITY_DN13203_c0_g1~~TRINITY_DN13203_c0_g1_i5.p2  ORF type:complete len:146 (+),score=13.82 TRINITY_DN13203_c0_g1_i5:486-923(+)
MEICPHDAIYHDEEFGFITDSDKCTACGLCVERCIYNARALMGQTYTPRGLFEEIKRDIPFFNESSGGITVSGGEPMLHTAFLKPFFEICLLYTSDAADDTPCVDLGGRRIIKKKKHTINRECVQQSDISEILEQYQEGQKTDRQ